MKFANIFTLKLCLKRSLLTEAFTSHYSHAQHGLAIFALVQDNSPFSLPRVGKRRFHSFIEFYVTHLKNQELNFDHCSTLRLVFTSDEVVVGVVLRSVEQYDLVKIKPTESEAEH